MMFYQNGKSLYQVAGSTTLISNNVQYIAFTYPRTDDPTIMSVALTMEKATYQGGYKALELSIQKVRIGLMRKSSGQVLIGAIVAVLVLAILSGALIAYIRKRSQMVGRL